MLVLTRKKNESIIIGEEPNLITVVVVEVRGDKVRLGIEADMSIPVHREEVYNEIKRTEAGLPPAPGLLKKRRAEPGV